MKVCLSSLLPSFEDIYKLVQQGITLDFPTSPFNFYDNFSCAAIAAVQTACEAQISQAISVLLAAVEPMLDLIGKDLDFFPTIFGLPIRLFDLITLNIKDLITSLPTEAIDRLISLLLPSSNLNIAELNILEAVYFAIKGYFNTYLLLLQGLIDEVVSFLGISSFTLPTIPTPVQIMNQVFALLGVGNLQEILDKKLSLYQTFITAMAALGVPFILVDNFLWYLNSVQVEYTTLLNNATTQCINFVMSALVSFIENVLKNFMTFALPKFCFEAPI